MPNIPIYDTPALSIRPSETGVESHAAAARRLPGLYNQQAGGLEQLAANEKQALSGAGRALGGGIAAAGDQYVNYLDHQQISAFSAESTQFMKDKTDQWNAIISDPKIDPNNPAVAKQFIDGLETDMQKLAGSDYLTTEKSRDFAERFIDRFRQHMTEKTSADLSTLAGIALKTNVQKTVNSLSSMVASDPSSLDFALGSVGHAIDAKVSSSPTLDATTAASVRGEVGMKAKMDIVKSAVIGMIQKNPNVDLDAVQKKYGDMINGSEMKMFQKAAQTQAKADLLQTRQLEIYQRQQEEHQAKVAAAKVVSDNFSADENGNITIKPGAAKQALDIARQYPQAGPAMADTMLKFIQGQQDHERKVVDNPAVVTDFSNRLFDTNRPLTEMDLMRASTKGDISNQTYTRFKGMIQELEQTPLKGPVYQETMKAVHDALTVNVPGIPGKDTVGSQKYASFVQSFIPQYLSKYRAGTLEPNALDINDPNSMISKAMAPFKRTSGERMKDYLAGMQGLTEASKAAPARVSTKAEYDALPVGTHYIGRDGQTYEKR